MSEKELTKEARDAVERTLERAERGERNALSELRDALCGYVGRLRSQGVSRELTIDTVRTLVRPPRTAEGAYGLLPSAREALVELSVQWCAEEYDRATETAAPANLPATEREHGTQLRAEPD